MCNMKAFVRIAYKNRMKECKRCGIGFSVIGFAVMISVGYFIYLGKNSGLILYLLSLAIVMELISLLFFYQCRKADDARIAYIDKIRQQKNELKIFERYCKKINKDKVREQIFFKLFDA